MSEKPVKRRPCDCSLRRRQADDRPESKGQSDAGLEIYCTECRKPVAPDARVCTSCGVPTVLYEPVWELRRNRSTWACELRYHGGWGVEAHILHCGYFRISQRFNTRALAVQWAEGERRALEAARYDDPAPDGLVS
jgi:hypothetical protein